MVNLSVCAAALLLAFWTPRVGEAAGVGVGQKAPDFQAESTAGTLRLSDFLGKKRVVLAFYLKDFTGG